VKTLRLFVLAPLLVLAGCGLYQVQTLLIQPGSVPASSSSPIFTINYTPNIGNPITGPGFQGFEIYYKIIPNNQVPPSFSDTSTTDDLKSAGCLPVCSDSDRNSGTTVLHTKPLIPVASGDLNSSFSITIDFSLCASPLSPPYGAEPVVTYNGTRLALKVRRSVPDNSATPPTPNQPKPFVQLSASNTVYVGGDVDSNALPSVGPVSLVLYALSYGQSGGYDEWSPPAFLGSVSLVYPE
jgi:hypothetical protein